MKAFGKMCRGVRRSWCWLFGHQYVKIHSFNELITKDKKKANPDDVVCVIVLFCPRCNHMHRLNYKI